MFQPIGKVLEIKTQPTLARSLEAAVILAKINECGQGRWEAVRFRRNALTLVAPSPIAAQELTLRKGQIIAEINSFFAQTIVEDLFIKS